jgi:hypothetical protein
MNNFKSIDNLINEKNLTKDEINSLSGFIEDARQRKKLQNEYAADLGDKEMTLKESLYMLAEIMENLADKVGQIAKNMEIALLIETPESSFYRE